jgi:hypothetical protein
MSLSSVVQEVEAKVEGFLEKLNPFAHKAEAEVTAEATVVEGDVAADATADAAKVEAVVAPVVTAAETKVEAAVGADAAAAAEKAVAAVVPTV